MMKIQNKTKNTLVAEHVDEAKNIAQKGIGLILTKKPHALLLRTRFGIHTFGMQYPIDALILDSSNKVVKLKRHLKPNRIFLWNPKYSTVIELPAGTIISSKTGINDEINLT